MPQIDKVTELRNVKLKKVIQEPEKPAENKDKNIQGDGKNFLQNALSTAIMNRRKNIHMHDD